MEKETALPKNIRQIGEVRGEEKICLEDYVMTCIHKKDQQEKEGYLGIFFGDRRQEAETEYVFIRGILELSKTWEPEFFAEKLEEQRAKYFPDWTVQGCCVIGVYDTDRIREVRTRIEDAGHIVYHLQEQEETLYAQRDGTYHKIKGYFIFYEQNRKMQAYLSEEFKEDRVEKESFPDRAIKSFREKVRIKSERKSSSMLKMASSFFVVTVLAVAAVTVTKMDDLRKVRQTMNASDNAAENEAQDHIYMDTAGMGENTNQIADNTSGSGNSGGGTSGKTAVSSEQNSGGNTAAEGAQSGTGSTAAGEAQSNTGSSAAGGESSMGSSASESQDSMESTASAGTGSMESTTAENSAAGVVESSMENTAGAKNSTGGVAADGMESTAGSAITDENAPIAGGNMTASDGLATAASGGAGDGVQTAAQNDVSAADSASSQDGAQATGSASVQSDDTTLSAENTAADQTAGENSASASDDTLQSAFAQPRRTQATYTIREGDTLADICSKYYGNFDKLDLICSANGITDANLIMPGQKIVLP